MKILSYGHIKPETTFCRNCGAELEYIKADVLNIYRYERIVCPVCKELINVGKPLRGTVDNYNWENESLNG